METNFCIRIDKEGNWLINQSPITNRHIFLYFNKHIVKDKNGLYFLDIKNQKCEIEVEDTPYIVKHVHILRDEPLKLEVLLNDEEKEIIPWEFVWAREDSQIYCLVKGGDFEARFNRNSQFELGWMLQYHDKTGRYYLNVDGEKYYLMVKN